MSTHIVTTGQNPFPATPPAKVVRIISRLNVGGPARQVCYLHTALKGGFETRLITGCLEPLEGDMSYLLGEGEGVYRIGEMSRPVSLLKDLRAFLAIVKILRRERPQIVHTHAAKAGALGRMAALFCRVPLIFHTYHGNVFSGYFGGLRNRTFTVIERALNRATTRVIAISDSQAEELSQKYGVAPRAMIETIRTGFEFREPAMSKSRARSHFGIPQGKYVVAWAGRLTGVKDVPLMLEVAARAAKSAPGLYFIVAGDGEERALVEAAAKAATNLRWVGWQSDMPSFWAASDAALLTSRNEGTPASLIEAMAQGKPFVATDVGGVKDLAGSGKVKNGFLCPRDPGALLEHLIELQADPALSISMANAAKAFSRSQHSARQLLAGIESLYRRHLAGSKS